MFQIIRSNFFVRYRLAIIDSAEVAPNNAASLLMVLTVVLASWPKYLSHIGILQSLAFSLLMQQKNTSQNIFIFLIFQQTVEIYLIICLSVSKERFTQLAFILFVLKILPEVIVILKWQRKTMRGPSKETLTNFLRLLHHACTLSRVLAQKKSKVKIEWTIISHDCQDFFAFIIRLKLISLISFYSIILGFLILVQITIIFAKGNLHLVLNAFKLSYWMPQKKISINWNFCSNWTKFFNWTVKTFQTKNQK